MTLINPTTFQPDADDPSKGTVELTLRGETRRVPCSYSEHFGWIIAGGIEGRYRTGNKFWPGTVRHLLHDGREWVHFGRFDNHPKFRHDRSNLRFKD